MAKVSDQTKWISLNNEPCLARPTVINLNSNELYYNPLMLSLDRCNGSLWMLLMIYQVKNTFQKKPKKVLHFFNMITRRNELKKLKT